MYYALTLKNNIITGVHESLTPITDTTFVSNPDFKDDRVTPLDFQQEYETGTDLRIYKEDGTKQTEAWQIENGYMELPKNKKVVDGVLVDWYKVFVQADTSGKITSINSDAFLTDTGGWTEIDEGEGDAFHHAQGNYLPKPLMTTQGVYQYKLVDGTVQERTAEEIAVDIAAIPPPPPTTEEKLAKLLADNETLKTKIAEIEYRNIKIEKDILGVYTNLKLEIPRGEL